MNNDWTRFRNGSTPSTVEIDPLFYSYLEKGSSVIDIGCGWGKKSFLLYEKGYDVTGIDSNQNEIEHANDFLKNNYEDTHSRIHFTIADACALPFEDNSFDSFLMQSLLTSVIKKTQQLQIIKEASRVLKKGGIGYLGVFCLSQNNPHYLKKYIMDFPITGQWGTFIVKDGENELYWAHHYSKQELSALMPDSFDILLQKDTPFTSYHGNSAQGRIIIVKKK